MQFDAIEMLDIPDDLSVTLTSQTESMSDSSKDSKLPRTKTFPPLQEWLALQSDLQFQFDKAAYAKSAKHTNEFAHAQAKYITLLYKVLEDLSSNNVNALDTEDEEDEPIGVVSTSKDIGVNKDNQYKLAKINEAFSKLVEHFTAFHDTVADQVDDEDAEAYEDLSSLLDCILANCFAISERQKPELILKWINKYDPQPENEFIDAVMYNHPTPYKHPQFWTLYMRTLLARGLFDKASISLESSKYEELQEECPELHAIVQDLITLVGNYTPMVMKGQFAEWKYIVCEFRDNFKTMKVDIVDLVHVTIASQIHELLCLLSGFPKTTASFVSSWYEMYGALSLFQVRDDESVFTDYYNVSIEEKGANVSLVLETAFRDVLSQNYMRVILAIDRYDTATAAYVSKLFELRGFLSSYYIDFTQKSIQEDGPFGRRLVSDYLLIRNAFECLEEHALVPVGIGLLLTPVISNTSENLSMSREIVSEFLPHYECFTNDDMEWALTICAKLNIPGVVKKLYLKQGEKSLKEGHIYEAMNMLVHCYDETNLSEETAAAMAKVHHIAWDLMFQECLLNSSANPDELLMNIVNNNVDPEFTINPVIKQCISPYAVLAEYFHELKRPESFPKNLSRLFHLLRFKYMPKKFMPLLLAQFLPFFAMDQFRLPDLIVLIELIDLFELPKSGDDDEDIEELYQYAIENVPDVEEDWRVRVVKNGDSIPQSVNGLIKELRERIVAKVGRVYIGK